MTYLITLIVLIICMATIDARYRLFVFSQPLPALLTLLAGTCIFLLWDIIAIGWGNFLHRESPLMTGVMVGEQLPLEEAFFLFFLCYQTMILVTGFLQWRSFRKSKKFSPTRAKTADGKETM